VSDCSSANQRTGHSLIHIVISPVVLRCTVPLADKTSRNICDATVGKARDEVDATDDVCGIEKPECALLVARNKLNSVQPLCFPSCPVFLVHFKPTDPEDIHVHQFGQAWMQDSDSVDPEDLHIEVWAGRVATRESHHVWTTPCVDLVYLSSEVVCGVVNTRGAPLLEAVAMYKELVVLIICKVGRFWIILLVKNTGEEVIGQLWNKVLVSNQQDVPWKARKCIPLGPGHPHPCRIPIGKGRNSCGSFQRSSNAFLVMHHHQWRSWIVSLADHLCPSSCKPQHAFDSVIPSAPVLRSGVGS
jgi:hypothetical protein